MVQNGRGSLGMKRRVSMTRKRPERRPEEDQELTPRMRLLRIDGEPKFEWPKELTVIVRRPRYRPLRSKSRIFEARMSK